MYDIKIDMRDVSELVAPSKGVQYVELHRQYVPHFLLGGVLPELISPSEIPTGMPGPACRLLPAPEQLWFQPAG